MNSLKSMATGYAMKLAKDRVCSADISSVKQRAIQAIQLMPDTMVSSMIKSSPICSPQGMMGGKKRKTRKQKRKARKTRKH